jgi:hypothetical protein
MKYVNMRIPDCGPFGDTFREANTRAMVAALLVKSPAGGCVESVFTFATQRRLALLFRLFMLSPLRSCLNIVLM